MNQMTTHKKTALLVAKKWANAEPVFLDTETTGTDESAEICDLALVDWHGAILMDTLIKPTKPIPPAATAIHGIGNDTVENAPSLATVLPEFLRAISGKLVLIYNAEFDTRIIAQSIWAAMGIGLNPFGFGWFIIPEYKPGIPDHLISGVDLDMAEKAVGKCVMNLFAQFDGTPGKYRGHFKWHKLNAAAAKMGVDIDGDKLHRALYDTVLTRLLFLAMLREGAGDE